jgi:DNA repair exonuclease SbcCD ATPase subunit
MRILSVEIQDILSIQSATIKFGDTGLVLVEGWNYDTQRANGAGKTAIFNGLSFALYDKLPRKITASEILRGGCKAGFAKASILCGDDVWTVIRSRPKGVQFLKNDVVQEIGQSEFESFLRLSYEQFLLTIYTPQANSGKLIRFLSSADSDKKQFLLQLLNLDQFSDAKKVVDGLIAQRQAGVDLETGKVTTARARIETYEESLVDTASLQEQVDTLKLLLTPYNKEIIELSSVLKPDQSKYSATEDTIRSKQQEIAQAKAKRSMLHERYRELSNSVHNYNSAIACSECGSSLDTEEGRLAHQESQKKIKEKILIVKGQIDETDLVISKEAGIVELSKKIRDKKQVESADFQDAQLRLTDLKDFVKTKQQEAQQATLKLSRNSEFASKIEALQTGVDISLNIITNYKKELELYKTLSSIYSPTGAQAYVLDSVVDSFNEVIQKYVDMLAPNMSYVLNSFKENAKGDVVAKFSETLTKGGQVVSVGSLSGGEEKGLSLCVDFALLEVLETQFGMTLNPIILDEPFDGLDMPGREIVIDLLENLARNRQIFVIDHSSEAKSMFSECIRIELRDGISTVNAPV